jgi:hypothetical protein
MEVKIILSILNVQSSYSKNIEVPANGINDALDTVQWYICGNSAFRIRTYSIDHDIHVHRIGPTDKDLVALAVKSNSVQYSDILRIQHILKFDTIPDVEKATELLKELKLPGAFESVSDGYLFWNPDSKVYISQSDPGHCDLK